MRIQKFPCFQDKDLYKSRFSNNTIAQVKNLFDFFIKKNKKLTDDDKCSSDELLEKATNSMVKSLFQAASEYNLNVKNI